MHLLVISPFGEQVAEELPRAFADAFDVHIPEAWPATVAEVTQAVREHVKELGPDTVLFGHSMNGALALASAAELSCRGVIAVAAAQQLPADRAALEANWEARAEPRRKALAAELTAAYEAADDSAKPEIFRRYDNLRRWYDIDTEPDAPYVFTPEITQWVGSVIASGAEVDWPAAFEKVRAPVFLALGEFDFAVPLDPWLDAVPGDHWWVEVFARSGHTPFVEQPDEFVATVARWLATI